MNINERLRLFGELKFATAKEFADALGIYPQSLNNYYSGKRTPSVEIVQRAMELGCDPLWLLSGRGDMILTTAITSAGYDQSHIDPRIREFLERDIFKEFGFSGEPREAYDLLRTEEAIPAWENLSEQQRRFFCNTFLLMGQIAIDLTRTFDRAVAELLVQREEGIKAAISRFSELLASATLDMNAQPDDEMN